MTPNRHNRRWSAGWVEREVTALDALATVPTDVLEARVLAWNRCLRGSRAEEPPDPPPDETSPDRWLAAWMCAGCHVRRECLETELRDAGVTTVGVWGGLAEDDRRALLALWQAHPGRGRWDHSGDVSSDDEPMGGHR